MPIIFASAILAIFPKIGAYLPFEGAKEWAMGFPTSGWFMFWFGLMILFFSYFWVATQFNPIQIADDLKKRGGYIPAFGRVDPRQSF